MRKQTAIGSPTRPFLTKYFPPPTTCALPCTMGISPMSSPSISCYKNCIYIHCALEGHKLDCINRNPNVAFTPCCRCAHSSGKIDHLLQACAGGTARPCWWKTRQKKAASLTPLPSATLH